MLRRYRIGEVVSMLGLKPYTLKHYEEKGLIKADIDPESGYRYYTYRHIGQIIMIRNYRAMGFSVEEAKSILNGPAATELDEIERRIEDNITQIEKLKHQNRILGIRQSSLKRCLDNLGTWEIVEKHSGVPFLPHFRMGQISSDLQEAMSEEHWTSLMEEAEIASQIDLGANDPQPVWGLAFYGSASSLPGLLKFVNRAPEGRRLDCFVEGPRTESMEWVVDAARAALLDSGQRARGCALCIVNSVNLEHLEMSHQITITIPIEK